MATYQISLEAEGTIQFSFLPARIAEALHDDENTRKTERKKIATELLQMVAAGTFILRDPLTLEPLSFECDEVPGYGVLAADDLRSLLEYKGVNLHYYGPQKIHVSAQHQHISVEDAITLVINAIDCPDDVLVEGFTAIERLVISIERNFLSVCDKLNIKPCLPDDPEEEYTGADGQSIRFGITAEEFHQYAAHYGVVVSTIPGLATPAPTPLSKLERDMGPKRQTGNEQALAALFDSVHYTTLEAMFPAAGKWQRFAERAKRNGLDTAKTGRGKFNPMLAALWWVEKQNPGWALERVYRRLANNLPPRSKGNEHLLTGDYD